MQKISDLKEKFKNKELFDQAFTHRSWINENPGKRESNERLEFLGDAILEFVVTDYLYSKLPDKEEGSLTFLRANIVNTTNLSGFARKMGIGDLIFLSKGESVLGKNNNSLLADTVEALIGAMYLDNGLTETTKFIIENLLSDLNQKLKGPLKSAKSLLQEISYEKKLPIPIYRLIKSVGPVHSREFTMEVLMGAKSYGRGVGKSKQEAEQKAASVALQKLTG